MYASLLASCPPSLLSSLLVLLDKRGEINSDVGDRFEVENKGTLLVNAGAMRGLVVYTGPIKGLLRPLLLLLLLVLLLLPARINDGFRGELTFETLSAEPIFALFGEDSESSAVCCLPSAFSCLLSGEVGNDDCEVVPAFGKRLKPDDIDKPLVADAGAKDGFGIFDGNCC
jgi:hypothetical protein